MLRFLLACTMALLMARPASSQTPGALSVPADTTHWSLEGNAEVTDYEGRRCLHLDGAEATVRGLELRILSPEDDAVYLPLKKGRNELVLAVSELGGGWGFNCRLAPGVH